MPSHLPTLPPLPAGRLLGVAGAPGAGKSTFCAALLGSALIAITVPMDGFHYADVELARRGLLDLKGAPDTFDAEGYAALLGRVAQGQHPVVAPMFDRRIEQPIAGAIAVPSHGLVATEGNYLMLDEPRWETVRHQMDAVWHVTVDGGLRRERLIERHVTFGKTPTEARDWVDRVDEPNACLVEAAASRADAVIDLTDWS